MTIPSWAVKGAKVICIQTMPHGMRIAGAVYPELNQIYTIRKVVLCTIGKNAGRPSLLLEEVVNVTSINPLAFGVDSDREASMPIDAFRPLITRSLEQDIFVHFSQHLRTDQRVPEKA